MKTAWYCILMFFGLVQCAQPSAKKSEAGHADTVAVVEDDVSEFQVLDLESIISELKILRREYYRDTVPYVIEIEGVAADAEETSALTEAFRKLYCSKIDGPLVDRTVRYFGRDVHCAIKIEQSARIQVYVDSDHWFSGMLLEDSLGKRRVEIQDGTYPNKVGSSVSLYLNGNQLTIPAMGIDMYYDALEKDFINLKCFPDLFLFDIRYNTDNNFAHIKLYPEPICWMRYVAARDFMDAARSFLDMGYKIKVFDTYRPRDVQFKMWEVVPDARFVANPNTGSIHNRGGAADITLCDADGNNLDMGTDFDYFGVEAYPSCRTISAKAQENRKLLSENITKFHFKAITSEWWHFSHTTAKALELSNFVPRENLNFLCFSIND